MSTNQHILRFSLNKFIILFLLIFYSKNYSQNNIEKIIVLDNVHYITTDVEFPITGTYMFKEVSEPIVQLNANGSGMFQDKDLQKFDIQWGIECFDNGIPKYSKGFNYAIYTLWYKTNNFESWTEAHFSIHFEKKKMFIQGDRVKSYTD